MKRVATLLLTLAISRTLVLQPVQAEPKVFAQPPDKGRPAWLLDMLKTIADAEDLTDPAKVGAILGVTFNKAEVTNGPSFMESFAKTSQRNEYTPAGKTWFAAGESGYASTGNWKLRGGNGFVAGVDPTAKGGQVNFKYFESRRFGLPDDDAQSIAPYRAALHPMPSADPSPIAKLLYGLSARNVRWITPPIKPPSNGAAQKTHN